MTKFYAGIGSRQTPPEVLKQMTFLGEKLATEWTLRSGHAEGADMAFEQGVRKVNQNMEIFIPWFGFNGANNHLPFIRPKATKDLADYAAAFHPAWDRCTDAAKLMHMRNVCQILGEYGDAPVAMVICWTPHAKRGGGTGQALRIAEFHNIPIFDLAAKDAGKKLCDFVNSFDENQARIAC